MGETVTGPPNEFSVRVPLILLTLALVLTVAFAWLWIINLGSSALLAFGNRSTPLALTASGIVFVVVGAMVTSRRPGNRIGWVALGIGLPAIMSTLANEYAIYSTVTEPGSLPGGDVVAWLANLVWVPPVGLLGTVLVLLYPDGDLPSRRWKGVLIASIVGMAGAILFFALAPGPLTSLDWIENPFGLAGSESWIEWLSLGFFLLAATVPLAAWSMRQRYRRAHGVARAQIRWFAAAAALVAFTYVGQFILSVTTGSLEGGSPAQRWLQTLAVACFGTLGFAVGVAVLRYRLYDIDRIISRTVSYVLVVAFLGLVVLGLVSLFALFLPSDDPLVVAVSTLVVFALFTPVRRRVQAGVDRRFNRSRYDAALVVESLAGLLRERVDPEGVVDDWRELVEETMQPTAVGVWVRED
ncbi:MAG: hypothetical protein WD274_03415 [Acidimicrobiia bacterium]